MPFTSNVAKGKTVISQTLTSGGSQNLRGTASN